jgi:putative salt-induced outer membrane protein YdiY
MRFNEDGFVLTAVSAICCLLAGTTAASPAVVTLGNGDLLRVESIEKLDSGWRLRHPVLGDLVLDDALVTEVVFVDADQAAAQVAESANDDGVSDGSRSVTGFLPGWERKFELTFSGAGGNSDNQDLNVGFRGGYEDDHKRWALAALYSYSESESVRSENEFYAELTRDWLYPGSRWFGFANGRYDWDDFKDWDHRISAAVGVGYQIIDDDVWSVAGRLGVGGNQTFGGTREEFTPEGIAGLNGNWRINALQMLTFRTTFYPSFDDLGEYRNLSEVNWEYTLADDADVAVKLGVSNEYDSSAEGDTDPNDFKYQGGLVWGF